MDFMLAMLAAFLVPFLVAVLLPRRSVTLVGIPVVMLIGYFLSEYGVPARGSSDAAGHGMAAGYYAMMVYAGLIGAGLGWLAQLARYVWPALTGWRYAAAAVALLALCATAGLGFLA